MTEHPGLEILRQIIADKNLGFPEKPELAADLHTFEMPDGLGIQIRGLLRPILLRGHLVDIVVPWLLSICDGKKTLTEIINNCPSSCSSEDAVEALLLLFRKGVIGPSTAQKHSEASPVDETLRRQRLFWGRQLGLTRNNGSAVELSEKISQSKLLLIGNGLFGTVCYDLLTRAGFNDILVMEWGPDKIMSESLSESVVPAKTVLRPENSLEDASRNLNEYLPFIDLAIVALRNCGTPFFQQLNQLCLSHHRRWLYGHDRSAAIDIGPFVDPYSSACWTCMHLRQASSIDDAMSEALYDEEITVNPPNEQLRGESISMATLAASVLVEEAIRITTLISPPAYIDNVLRIDITGTFKSNKFRRVPRCPDCYRGKHERVFKDDESLTGV